MISASEMSLSQLIREGSKLTSQAFYTYSADNYSGTCAMGGAAYMLSARKSRLQQRFLPPKTETDYLLAVNRVSDLCRKLGKTLSPCDCQMYDDTPALGIFIFAGGRAYSVKDTIAHLNDYHRWTRERIADWVETLEREKALLAGISVPQSIDPLQLMLQLMREEAEQVEASTKTTIPSEQNKPVPVHA